MAQPFFPGQVCLTSLCLAWQAWCRAFQAPLQTVFGDDSKLEEKGTACAAAELLSAMIASGAAFCCEDGAHAWDQWIGEALQNALAKCPLEMADMWGLAVRFAVGGLCRSSNTPALWKVLEMLKETTLNVGSSATCIFVPRSILQFATRPI